MLLIAVLSPLNFASVYNYFLHDVTVCAGRLYINIIYSRINRHISVIYILHIPQLFRRFLLIIISKQIFISNSVANYKFSVASLIIYTEINFTRLC